MQLITTAVIADSTILQTPNFSPLIKLQNQIHNIQYADNPRLQTPILAH